MRHLSKHTVYWPGLDADIADYINCCKTCTQHKAKQAVQPMLHRDVPDSPWQELAADFFTHNHKEYLVIVDTFLSSTKHLLKLLSHLQKSYKI